MSSQIILNRKILDKVIEVCSRANAYISLDPNEIVVAQAGDDGKSAYIVLRSGLKITCEERYGEMQLFIGHT